MKFEAKLGIFGEYGWKEISFLTWLKLKIHGNYVTRVRWRS